MADAMKILAELFTRDVNLVILGALLGAVLSLAATYFYDRLKSDRERAEARESIVNMLIAEAESNLAILKYNTGILNQDLEARKQQKQIVLPLAPLATSGWDIGVRSSGLRDDDRTSLKPVADLYGELHVLNQHISSRETFRLNNQALSGVNETMLLHNAIILREVEQATKEITESQVILRARKAAK